MKKSLISNVVFGDVDPKDYPDFVDAFIESADYNGVPMNEKQLEDLNEDSELVHELLIESL